MTGLEDATDLAHDYTDLLRGLKEDFVGRDEAVDVLALATLCREHVLLVGPPGTAKTALLTRFAQLFDARMFTYLLTRFTEPSELFGPVDVEEFQQGRYRVRTVEMLPHAHLAFLDEVFEASSAILNTLLTLINERVFHNGSHAEPSELITLLGSSNRIPDDPLLAAFGDRFLLRADVSYVDDEDIAAVLDVGWGDEQQRIRAARAGTNGQVAPRAAAGGEHFSLAALTRLQQAVATVDLTPSRALYVDVLRALRSDRVAFSDRRAVKAQKVIAASAVLAGRRQTRPEDLAVLAYLWTDRRDQDTIRRTLELRGVEPARAAERVRGTAEIALALRDLVNRRNHVRSPAELRAVVEGIQTLRAEILRDHPDADHGVRHGVEQELRRTVELLSERDREERDGV